jgi:glycosyltransferase involved in cell wall biosynthesis
LKVAYVTTYDPASLKGFSGSGAFMFKSLRSAGLEVFPVGPLRQKHAWLFIARTLMHKLCLPRRYLRDREPLVVRDYARQIRARLEDTPCDVVFSPGTVPVAYLNPPPRVAFWSDATFAGLLDFYPGFSRLCAETTRNGHHMEQTVLDNSSVAIYSSEWAAGTATRNYRVDPAKVKVVPFGANIESGLGEGQVAELCRSKPTDVCRLLFIGVNWERKGGQTALEVARALNARGMPAELHVVGCKPPVRGCDFVKLHGFIGKGSEQGRKQLAELFSRSHFFILPSRADCVPVVFAEACAFGLPCLGTKVGGIPTAIRDGVNGQTFPLDADAGRYCDFIAASMASPAEYANLCATTFREYATRLNWEVAGQRVREILEEFCASG